MFDDLVKVGKRFATLLAGVGLFARVFSPMRFESRRGDKRHFAVFARIGFFTSVPPAVHEEVV